jgi:hypothetical protein
MKKHAAATAADPRTTLTAAILSMDLLTCRDKINDSTNGQPRGDLAGTMEHSNPVAVGRPCYGNQGNRWSTSRRQGPRDDNGLAASGAVIPWSASLSRRRRSRRLPERSRSAASATRTRSTSAALIWLDHAVVARLRAMRGPGESYSDVVLRLAEGVEQN